MSNTKVFYTKEYKDLALDVIEQMSYPLKGEIEAKIFPDGESYHRIINSEDIKGDDVILVGGLTSDKSILDVYNIASTLATQQIRSLHLVIPYMNYSTMERAVKEGEVVKAKNIARMFSSIPQASRGNFIYFIDLHSEGIPFYFEGATHVTHLYAKEEVRYMIDDIINLKDKKDFVLASTDAGRAKWVESLANDCGLNAAFVLKRRDDDGTEVTAINADVKDKNVIIYDDMIRSGGSLINAANAYKAAGADKIYACTTHGIFCDSGLEKLKNSNVIERIYMTNTHVNCQQNLDFGFTSLVSVASLIAKGLKL